MNHPINNIRWTDADLLDANEWNPNVVFSAEMKLLEFSILTNGWIQPILVAPSRDRFRIIDGFHRATLAKASKRVRDLTGGKVPLCVLDISEPEAMMLTVRINRAKGSHVSLKMHDLVSKLVDIHGISKEQIGVGIGASADEVELLLRDGVFAALNIKEHKYSKAWVPK